MMNKSWSSNEEVSFYFSRSCVKFEGHAGQKSLILTQIWRFRTVTQVLKSSIEKVPYCFSRSILTRIERFRTVTHVWCKPWCSIEEVPYCFVRSYIKLQGHTGWKIDYLNPIWVRLLGRSQLSNPSDLPYWHKFAWLHWIHIPNIHLKICRIYLRFEQCSLY